jgi:non-specific serine/threonine protein kinase
MAQRDAPLRQQSCAQRRAELRAPGESSQRLFRRTGIFSGVFALDAAEAVCADTSLNLLPGLLNLTDKNLLLQVDSGGSAACVRFLETVRAYALEQLRANNEYAMSADRLANHMLALTEAAARAMDGSGQAVWMDRLESMHDHIRAALRWFIDSGQRVDGLRLAIALQPFWAMRGHGNEGRDWFDLLLADVGPNVSQSVHAQALNGAHAGCVASRLCICARSAPGSAGPGAGGR